MIQKLLKYGLYFLLFIFVMKSAMIGLYTGSNSHSALALATIVIIFGRKYIIRLFVAIIKKLYGFLKNSTA